MRRTLKGTLSLIGMETRKSMKRVSAFFYAAASGREPVREWLMQLERQARVFFYIDSQQKLILLHALIKKTRTTPARDVYLARKRMADHVRSMQ